jgi:Ca2+-binding RTX toxin-like protein
VVHHIDPANRSPPTAVLMSFSRQMRVLTLHERSIREGSERVIVWVVRRLLIPVLVTFAVGLPGVALAVERTGGPGNDRLQGTDGADRLSGRGGNDVLIGLRGNDLLAGDAGRDRLRGGPGADTLLGGAGRDVIIGGGGRDIVAAGYGNDVVDVRGGGADRVSCGPGNDFVRADASDSIASDCESVQR